MTNVYLRTPLEANSKVMSSDAALQLRSGESYDVRRIEVAMDSTCFVNTKTGAIQYIGTNEIQSIRVTNHLGGALEGFMFGGLGGLGVGVAASSIGLIINGEQTQGGALMAVGALIVGSTGGLAIGAAQGSRHVFIFPCDSLKATNQSPDSSSLKN